MLSGITCPECGSENVVPIVYGLPSWEAWEEELEGKIRLGGCCISEDSPKYACKDCHCEWGGDCPPKGEYSEIRCIRVSFEPVLEPTRRVYLEVDLTACRVIWIRGRYREARFEKTIDGNTARSFAEGLRELRVMDWAQRYVNPYVLDGFEWHLEIIFDDVVITRGGSNAYPRKWDEFCRLMRELSGSDFGLPAENARPAS